MSVDDLLRATGALAARRGDALGRVEREIRQSQAEALGRVGERLEALLERLAALDRDLDAATARGGGAGGAEALRVRLAARNALRAEALRIRHWLIIQREALGLARHLAVEQCYPVPGPRCAPAAAGPE